MIDVWLEIQPDRVSKYRFHPEQKFVMTDNGTGMERSYVHFTSDTDNANLGGV